MDQPSTKSIAIYLFLLSRNDTPQAGEASKMLVGAPSEKSAREQANTASKLEGYLWRDGHVVECLQLGVATAEVSGVIMTEME